MRQSVSVFSLGRVERQLPVKDSSALSFNLYFGILTVQHSPTFSIFVFHHVKCHDRISNNDGKTTFSPTIAESRTSQDAQKRQRAFFRPPCVPNPKIAEIHLLRHCRDRDVMFGRRDTEHKAMEVYRYYRSLRDSLSDSRLESLKSLKSLKSLNIEVIEVIEVIS